MAKQEFKNLVGYDSEGSVAARGDAPPVRPGGGRLGRSQQSRFRLPALQKLEGLFSRGMTQ